MHATYQEEWDRLEKLAERAHKNNQKKFIRLSQSPDLRRGSETMINSTNETMNKNNTKNSNSKT